MHGCSERFFEFWAGLVAKYSWAIIIPALLAMAFLAKGYTEQIEFDSSIEAYFANTLDDDFDIQMGYTSGHMASVPRQFKVIFETTAPDNK